MDLAPIQVNLWLTNPESEEALNECKRVAQMLEETSALVIRDPRVSEEDNNKFLDTLEKYFEQDESAKLEDAFPDLHYQVGSTPEGTEVPRCISDERCHETIKEFSKAPENSAILPTKPDAKWRFFHRIGPRPENTQFKELNAPPVIPKKFPNWLDIMDTWGNKLLNTAFTIAEMAAIGFGLERDAFTKLMKFGPHLLAPTGSDLDKHNKLNTVLAGFHRDLNFITFHGKSRFPGLDIWLREGKKVNVIVPDGCILAQAGMELETLTGGRVKAGWHQVIVNERTLASIQKAKEEKRSTWRISSTLFSHIASDQLLEPLIGSEEEKEEAKKNYPPILAGEHVNNELKSIKLAKE